MSSLVGMSGSVVVDLGFLISSMWQSLVGFVMGYLVCKAEEAIRRRIRLRRQGEIAHDDT